MTIIVKCDPFQQSASQAAITVEAPTRKGTVPVVGERVFVWTSETIRGEGLVLCGEVLHAEGSQNGKTRLTILPDGRSCVAPLRKADLLPHRTVRDETPTAGLAAKLYYQAHHKIVSLSPDEEDFLNRRFSG